MIGLSWENDRTVFLIRWPDTEDMPSLRRLTIANGALLRVVAFPTARTPMSIGLDASGRRAACRLDDFRSDIWLMTVPGVTR